MTKHKLSCNVLTTLHKPIVLISTVGGVAVEDQDLDINLLFKKREAVTFGRYIGIAPVVGSVVFLFLES